MGIDTGLDTVRIQARGDPRSRLKLEREAGIEPASLAWKAKVLPFNYRRRSNSLLLNQLLVVEGEGFEPSKAEPTDLQSVPFDRSGTPPAKPRIMASFFIIVKG